MCIYFLPHVYVCVYTIYGLCVFTFYLKFMSQCVYKYMCFSYELNHPTVSMVLYEFCMWMIQFYNHEISELILQVFQGVVFSTLENWLRITELMMEILRVEGNYKCKVIKRDWEDEISESVWKNTRTTYIHVLILLSISLKEKAVVYNVKCWWIGNYGVQDKGLFVRLGAKTSRKFQH